MWIVAILVISRSLWTSPRNTLRIVAASSRSTLDIERGTGDFRIFGFPKIQPVEQRLLPQLLEGN